MHKLLHQAEAVLFDFDGSLCRIFATLTDWAAADRVLSVLGLAGVALPPHLITTSDPIEVARFLATVDDREIALRAEQELRAVELEAVAGAAPTPGGHEAFRAVAASGRPVAIVSNNSPEAVEAYLALHRLTGLTDVVLGRMPGRPGSMKPHPYLVTMACMLVEAEPGGCVLIGDSVTDIEAAKAAGTLAIGLASQPDRAAPLQAAGADAVITGMTDLLATA
ncbi:HAD superfamily hydrolase (TIGR01509 family) [Allocatelliglobosispora scoriae]|uniref:HAD superfamily hydrolase (TIGR01509 family) n=1 Tax=Allocatelliglobosispora scoriae TaxID=643052 RepID=A0A841BVP2_9ACTN|nr:HAD family hydrolase [Allocatelliglobosispora scoriae]MBB5870830.1 HAD superfamily hydrolase (TIGR01509 family) [Allocatelliglobosispora scoriae]